MTLLYYFRPGQLITQILCKVQPGVLPLTCIQKIILEVPYFVEYKIPLVYLSTITISPPKLSDQLKKKFVYKYYKQGSAETNLQEITLVSYLATTQEDLAFFESVQRETNCFVDRKLFIAPVFDFSVQTQKYLFNTIDIGNLHFSSTEFKLAALSKEIKMHYQFLNFQTKTPWGRKIVSSSFFVLGVSIFLFLLA